MLIKLNKKTDWVILYSHGNSGDIGRIIDNYIDLALNLGVNVFGYDYSGYGLSTGKPSDSNLILDI